MCKFFKYSVINLVWTRCFTNFEGFKGRFNLIGNKEIELREKSPRGVKLGNEAQLSSRIV